MMRLFFCAPFAARPFGTMINATYGLDFLHKMQFIKFNNILV